MIIVNDLSTCVYEWVWVCLLKKCVYVFVWPAGWVSIIWCLDVGMRMPFVSAFVAIPCTTPPACATVYVLHSKEAKTASDLQPVT